MGKDVRIRMCNIVAKPALQSGNKMKMVRELDKKET
jgi:hypothetical protein